MGCIFCRPSRCRPVALTPTRFPSNIYPLFGRRRFGPTVDVGEFPHIFFPSLPMSADALLSPIRDHVAELGFELVDLRRTGTLQRPILQVRVDRPDSRPGQGITADDCARISRSLERFLESRAMVGPRYVLEVSSPGLERPLRWPEHWRRFVGRHARIRAESLRGRNRFEILSVPDEDHVVLRREDGSEVTLAFDAIREATLVADVELFGKGR
jgi:ribosome maturation factor RimP